MRFSVTLLLVLASVSVIGTVIEQDQSIDYYRLNYPENNSTFFWITYKQIFLFGLDHVYSTLWFFTILVLFFFSLLFCTLSTQLPILKHARRWSFLHSRVAIEKKGCYKQSRYQSLLNFVLVLSLKKYYVFQKGKVLYAYKGLFGRIAPIFVHFSIVFTLIGSLTGFTNGFVAQEVVPSGEIFHIQNFVKAGYFSSVSTGLLAKVDDFFLTFNRDKSVQQFFSNISLIDNQGNILLKKSVSVNTPLRFKGATFYQTDWQISALRLKMGSNKLMSKALQRNNSNKVSGSALWLCNLTIDKKHEIVIVISDLSDELLIYDNEGFLINTTRFGLWNVVYGVPIVFESVISSTGLQIKIDPGVISAYFGFLILIISISMSYLSYSQIWASRSGNRFHFGGNTNRALLKFEDDISEVHQKYVRLFRHS